MHKGTMWNRQVGRWLRRLVLGSVLMLAVLLVCSLLTPKVHDWRVERAIARFEAAPSQKLANRLCHLVKYSTNLTDEQANHIVRVLLRPKIVTRPSYPVGSFPQAIVEHRPSLFLPIAAIRRTHLLEGRVTACDVNCWPKKIGGQTRLTEPGVHRMELRYEGWISGDFRTIWDWRMFGGPRPFLRVLLSHRGLLEQPRKQYPFSFTVPCEFVITDDDRPPRIELLAGTDLNEPMHKAVTGTLHGGYGRYLTPTGDRWFRNSLHIKCMRLPAGIAFEPSLRLADGTEIPRCNNQSQRFRVPPDSGSDFWISAAEFLVETPGDYRGTILLRPDVNCAGEDPSMNAIWNGTLEFPIHFTVALERETVSK